MQGHVLTRMQADFDFLTDQRVVALRALGLRGEITRLSRERLVTLLRLVIVVSNLD